MKEIIWIEPDQDPKPYLIENWFAARKWKKNAKKMEKQILWHTNNYYVYLLKPSRNQFDSEIEPLFVLKSDDPSGWNLISFNKFDLIVLEEWNYFNRAIDKIKRLIAAKNAGRFFSEAVLIELGHMAKRYSGLDAGIIETINPQGYINYITTYIANTHSNHNYFRIMEIIYRFLFEGGNAADVEAEIEQLRRVPVITGLLDVTDRAFVFRLGQYDCYMRATGTCSLDLSQSEYAIAAAAEKGLRKHPMNEDSVHYCIRFRDHILKMGVENIAPSSIYEFYCGHSAFGDGQHRACIAKRSGHLLNAEITNQSNYLCVICSRRRAGGNLGNEFIDTELERD